MAWSRPALPRWLASLMGLGLAALSMGGCGSGGGARDAARDAPAVADPRAAICAEAGTSAVPFDIVQTIFNQDCVTCHSRGDDLNLSAGVAWLDLVNQPAPPAEACGGTLVVPDNPGASYLYQKLTNPSPCSGSQMPRTSLFPYPLPACVTGLVSAWIEEGAPGPTSDAATDGRRG
jgi:hypothetical protein